MMGLRESGIWIPETASKPRSGHGGAGQPLPPAAMPEAILGAPSPVRDAVERRLLQERKRLERKRARIARKRAALERRRRK
jgi:hypothetical protein